jgi:hypothetical protein
MPGAHSKRGNPRSEARSGSDRGWIVAITVVTIAVVAVGVTAFAMRQNTGQTGTTKPSADEIRATTHPVPFTAVAETPAAGATGVPSDATISVQFSEAIGAHSATPSLSPAIGGTWEVVAPTTYTFVASQPLAPSSTETVTVPGGAAGVISATGKQLAQASSFQFTVAQGSTLRLQQLLAQLGYLPLTFSPAGPVSAPQEAAQPQAGTFSWRFNAPNSLTSLWSQGSGNVIQTGAVMAFESLHGMTTDGLPGPQVWQQLLSAAQTGTMDPNPYNCVYVSESGPETATVFSNGAQVYSTLANTGVAAAATATGTFPVYARYAVTTMRGTNPDGSHYVDPGIPWVSYFNGGDALHGFVRGSYGFPQSDGCVEMPPANAAVVFPLTPIGTLVTVA